MTGRSGHVECRYDWTKRMSLTRKALARLIFVCECDLCREAVVQAFVRVEPADEKLRERWDLLDGKVRRIR